MKQGWMAAVLVGVAWAAVACGLSDAAAAQGTVERFMAASQRKDKVELKATLTKKAQQVMGDRIGDGNKQDSTESFVVGTAAINADLATVPVTQSGEKDQPMKFLLRREDGEWRIYGFTVSGVPGGEITFNFEEPGQFAGEVLKVVGGAMGAAMKDFGKGLGAGLKGFAEGFEQGLNQPTK